ncbi:Ribosome maturation factor RimM [Aquicella siphonis]|uniref:Ribosome maturation factor RimM n=1 Tax=Aquicella siphonis TaxID=254247 RepID=A0A5E4PH98_9COXI|nr:ribosome maturation factor RimM [Aquicella siphonis]VVC76284.1 Ribosome maturation factor RimM [Aquicella siphonis]
MKNANQAYIIVGKIGAAYGVHGWLKIYVYTEFDSSILDYQPWHLQQNNGPWTPVNIESARAHGKGLIVKLTGINSPEEARQLTGALIAVTRSQLPRLKENEYYWSDLIGLTVINKNGATLGKVIYLMATGSNDVLVVKGDREHAIPYLPGKVVTRVDLDKQEIHVDWELL